MSSEVLKLILLDIEGINFACEYKFAESEKRKFAADFAELRHGIIIEYEGLEVYDSKDASFTKSRHQTTSGYIKDCEKYNLASMLNFNILRYNRHTLDDPYQIEKDVKRCIDIKKALITDPPICNSCKEAFYIQHPVLKKICLECLYINTEDVEVEKAPRNKKRS